MLTDCKLPSFDALVTFHRRDPLGYEQFRTQILNRAVASAPPKRRPALERTMQSIEKARQVAKSPLEAAISAHSLMCGSLTELNDALHHLQYFGAEMQTILIVDKLKIESRNSQA